MTGNIFWGDPKVYLSLLAILISLAAFIFTLANQSEQNRRWDALNLGNVVIKETEFIKFNSLTVVEAQQIDWGYNVLLLQNANEQDKVFTINCLQIFDITNNQIIPHSKVCRTMKDVYEEIEDMHLTPSDVTIKRVFKGRISMENIGKTDVNNFSATVLGLRPNGNWDQLFASQEKRNLGGSQKLDLPLTINFTLEGNIPEQMNFEIKWEYQDANGVEHKKSQKMRWIRRENKWSFLDATEQ